MKRKLTRLEKGLVLTPSTNVSKLVETFESHFGTVRVQHVACDNGFQLPDVSAQLTARDAFAYRSAIGGLLYLARDRPDLAFPVKELSSKMSQPTVTVLQRLRKVMGYVKGTPEYAVMLEEPEAGQGKWKTTNDAFWILESASDSDWPSNREHRRSTSSGVHLVNGLLMFASSRTQKIVSLSSCEAELHAMVSTLADGIYIKRCLEFVTGSQVFHCLMTDSSSARQLCAKQGVGKLRHVSGKILWIQQHVLAGDVQVCQLPTVWNIADLGTKSLNASRVRFLLHELGVADNNGLSVIGEVEYNEQVERHGSRRQIMRLARNLCRVFTLLGLEPAGVTGATINTHGSSQDQCDGDEVSDNSESSITTYVFIFLLLISWEIFAYVGWKVYKRVTQIEGQVMQYQTGLATVEQDHNHLALQVAEMDTTVGEHNNRLVRAEFGLGETARDLDFLTDYAGSLQYGLVEIGGFRRFNELTPGQNRHMYTQERANMVSYNLMGGPRYLRLVSQHSTGTHHHADNTDKQNVGNFEESESEMEQDEMMEEDVHTREHLVIWSID